MVASDRNATDVGNWCEVSFARIDNVANDGDSPRPKCIAGERGDVPAARKRYGAPTPWYVTPPGSATPRIELRPS